MSSKRKPRLVFFLGSAGAGKTTMAKTLASKRKAVLLDMDTFMGPAAKTITHLLGLDPNDRDSSIYKKYCRDLGYRMTMDAALENAALGMDVFVVGPFTREIEDALWLEKEFDLADLSLSEIEVRALYLFLPDDHAYKQRLQARGSELDVWKLNHWSSFSQTLTRGNVRWNLPDASIRYLDNSGPLSEDKINLIEQFIY